MSVRLPCEVKARLDALSSGTGRPASFYVIQALEEYLEDMEDIYAADKAYKQWQDDGFTTTSWADVKTEFGL